jgi:hypothetical protein
MRTPPSWLSGRRDNEVPVHPGPMTVLVDYTWDWTSHGSAPARVYEA